MKRDIQLNIDLKLDTQEISHGHYVLIPKGPIDSNTTDDFKNRLDNFFKEKEKPHLLLDMSKVKYLSSVGLGALIALFKKSKDKGTSFGLYNTQTAVQRVLEISKLDFLLVKPEKLDQMAGFADYIRKIEDQKAKELAASNKK